MHLLSNEFKFFNNCRGNENYELKQPHPLRDKERKNIHHFLNLVYEL